MVCAVYQVHRLLGFPVAGLFKPIETAFALPASITVSYHALDQLRFAMDLVERIAGRQCGCHAGQDMGHQVQSHHIQQAKNT